jgi:uncharacterized membrane protein
MQAHEGNQTAPSSGLNATSNNWPAERPERLLESWPDADGLIDRLRRATGSLVSAELRPTLAGDWLGHTLHPMLTDLPIGCWTSAALLDVVGGRSSRRAAQMLVGMGLVLVPITALTGLSDWRASDDRRVQRVGLVHAAFNVGATVAYWRSWAQRRRDHHLRGVMWGMAGGLLATAGGYLGGHLAFGIDASNATTAPSAPATATRDAPTSFPVGVPSPA